MKKTLMVVSALSLLAAGTLPASAQTSWKPSKTISLIVPWGAGGASDQTGRILASGMEDVLGAKIAVINQPGASGSTGQRSAFDAPHDAYTWSANADASVATYQVQNLTPAISHRDWNAYFAIFTPCVIAVNPDSKITDWKTLVDAFKTRKVNVASAGIGAGGHIAAETFAKQMGITYNHVPYGGGNPAVVATVSGETEVVMQLSMELADMLRAKKLRAIVVMDNKPLKISGLDEIPAITSFSAGFPSVGFNFGLFIPKDIPAEAEKAIAAAFDAASKTKEVKAFAEQKGSVPVSIRGADANKIMDNAASSFGWLMYEGGVAPTNPQTLGIAKP